MSTPRIINSKLLRTAHAVASTPNCEARLSLSPAQLIRARHMANADQSVEQIMKEFEIKFSRVTVLRYLAKHGIRPIRNNKKAHRGRETGLPKNSGCRDYGRVYRPRVLS